MGILDMFKKKEVEKSTLKPLPEETPISQVLQMKERGVTNNQIIQILQQQNYNPQQIYDALAQAEARQSIEPYTETQEPPREELPTGAPLMQETMSPYTISSTHTTEEMAESIIEEKWQKIKKETDKINEWKDIVNTRLDRIEQKAEDMKSDLDGLHKAIITRVGEYDKTLTNVGTEIKAMEKVFKDVLPEMTNNIQELSKLTNKIKGETNEKEEIVKIKEKKPEKMHLESLAKKIK